MPEEETTPPKEEKKKAAPKKVEQSVVEPVVEPVADPTPLPTPVLTAEEKLQHLSAAAAVVLAHYMDTHKISAPDDLKYPGLKDLYEVLHS